MILNDYKGKQYNLKFPGFYLVTGTWITLESFGINLNRLFEW